MPAYIAYMLAPPKRENTRIFFSADELASQERSLHAFANDRQVEVMATFVEIRSHHKHRQVWPELKKALSACCQHNAMLIVPEIRNLTNNDGFAHIILQAFERNPNVDLICLDQPFINRSNFEALVLHSKEQRKYHGKLIKEGFDRSKAHPGNPHAKEVLNQINRSKIDNAIIFALLMKPVIHDYQAKGLSQRQMVNQLNQDGFFAPEGGKWVLSQLQKLLERIKINDIALNMEDIFKSMQTKKMSSQQMADWLNESEHSAPAQHGWDSLLVEKVLTRIENLETIFLINNLIIELQDLFEHHHIDDLTDEMLMAEVKSKGIRLPKSYILSMQPEDKS